MLQLHLRCPLNTWLQYIAQRQLQSEARNILSFLFGVPYIRNFMVFTDECPYKERILSLLLSIYELNPLVTDGFPTRSVSDAVLWRVFCSCHEQAVEQTFELSVIWDTMPPPPPPPPPVISPPSDFSMNICFMPKSAAIISWKLKKNGMHSQTTSSESANVCEHDVCRCSHHCDNWWPGTFMC